MDSRWAALPAVAAALLVSTPVGAAAQSGPGVATPETSAADPAFDDLVRRASQARDAGRLREAARLYREAVEKRPGWARGLWFLGSALYAAEEYDEARDAFRRLVAQDRENGHYLALKGLCEYRLRDYERAIGDLQDARALGIDSAEVRSVVGYHLGILLTRFEQFEASLETLSEGVREGNESPWMVEALGLSLLRLPLLPEELEPRQRELILLAGHTAAHWAAERREAARLGFEQLTSRFPEQRSVHYSYGMFLRYEEPDAALAEFRRELAASPFHVEAMLGAGLELLKRGTYGEARALAERAVAIAPRKPVARHLLGRILLEQGEVVAAIAQLEDVVALAPKSPEVRFNLARAYLRAGRHEDAERERAEFVLLDRELRSSRTGPQSIGGIDPARIERPEKE